MKLAIETRRWDLREPFVTAVERITQLESVMVTLSEAGFSGRGEALGVDYLGETPARMVEQLEAVRAAVEDGLDHAGLQRLLPPGGARNALDCALWDLRAKEAGRRVWELLGLTAAPVNTLYTLGLAEAEAMGREAARRAEYPALKLKLDARDIEARLQAVRAARPDATLVIDANGSWNEAVLTGVADILQICGVALLEQPLPRGEDAALAAIDCPIMLCADESCQSAADLPAIRDRYGTVNIKLDKCGGLTEAMHMVATCRQLGLEVMVGCMLGSSLAMAPGYLVAQHARFVDLDGPLWQTSDHAAAIEYRGASMQAPGLQLWG